MKICIYVKTMCLFDQSTPWCLPSAEVMTIGVLLNQGCWQSYNKTTPILYMCGCNNCRWCAQPVGILMRHINAVACVQYVH